MVAKGESGPADPPRRPVVVIPARLGSTRLPRKVLADIHGLPMIAHVLRCAEEADIGPVLVACAEREVADAVKASGGRAVMTMPEHPSGSDRAFDAVQRIDPEGTYDAVVNLQGDLPTLPAGDVRTAFALLSEGADIATLVSPIVDAGEIDDPNVVKAAVAVASGAHNGRALYFSRNAIPSGEGVLYHHIGIYAYRRAALARFIALPQGVLERREGLEQLRALEHGMRIDAALVDSVPLGVDTPADLDRARAMLAEAASAAG